MESAEGEVKHPQLKSGDSCPECPKGNLANSLSHGAPAVCGRGGELSCRVPWSDAVRAGNLPLVINNSRFSDSAPGEDSSLGEPHSVAGGATATDCIGRIAMASTLCCWKPCWIGSAIAGPVTGCDLGERRIHAKPREDGSERKRARLAQRDSPVSAGGVGRGSYVPSRQNEVQLPPGKN